MSPARAGAWSRAEAEAAAAGGVRATVILPSGLGPYLAAIGPDGRCEAAILSWPPSFLVLITARLVSAPFLSPSALTPASLLTANL